MKDKKLKDAVEAVVALLAEKADRVRTHHRKGDDRFAAAGKEGMTVGEQGRMKLILRHMESLKAMLED